MNVLSVKFKFKIYLFIYIGSAMSKSMDSTMSHPHTGKVVTAKKPRRVDCLFCDKSDHFADALFCLYRCLAEHELTTISKHYQDLTESSKIITKNITLTIFVNKYRRKPINFTQRGFACNSTGFSLALRLLLLLLLLFKPLENTKCVC